MVRTTVKAMHCWWEHNSAERYWLEVTDRPDIGVNLKAPQANEHGEEFWSYSLVRLVQPGDIVFHYDRNTREIASRSQAIGEYWEDSIVWAARGAYAREAGIQPHPRPGIYLSLEKHQILERPLDLATIRSFEEKVVLDYGRLKAKVGGPLYFPFEVGEKKRPIRPMQGYLFKLPAFFLDRFKVFLLPNAKTAVKESPASKPSVLSVGGDYRAADETTSVGVLDPFSRDPALMERSLRGHAVTQNRLAKFLMDNNILPRSPLPSEPDFDLAWIHDGQIWIAEIKSITSSNEEKQLRLGLGQLLRYCQLLRSKGKVRGLLAVEHAPTDASWKALCDDCGILLVWPESWDEQLKTEFSRAAPHSH